MTSKRKESRSHLRVPIQGEAWIAWGYERQRCSVVEFSPGGLTVRGMGAAVGTTVSIELPLPEGRFTLCGVVVHRQGSEGAAGIRYLELTSGQQMDLELYLWDLLAASSLPTDPKRCTVTGCDRPRKARGMCSRHYNRWRREQAQAARR